MRALKTLCTRKHLLSPTTDPASLLFFKPIQNPHVYRSVHSTNHRLFSQKFSLVSLFSSPKSETSDTAHTGDNTNDPANLCVRTGAREAESGPDSEARSGSGEISEERKYFGGGRRSYFGSSRKGKKRGSWFYSNCGYTGGQWRGSGRSCRSSGTMKQFKVGENGGRSEKVSGFEEVPEDVAESWLPRWAGKVQPLRLTDVNGGLNQLERRIPLYGSFGEEVSRVLGGGLVPGSLILVGGDPGVGKSTLLLQMAARIAEGCDPDRSKSVVYVCGEESVEQIGSRADRLGIRTKGLYLYPGTDIEDALEQIQVLSPQALIVDSIQTVHVKGVAGSAGGPSQVKKCTLALGRFAKETNIPVILSGHVTKSGEIAGPRGLQHIVDVILLLKGEKHFNHRLLHSVKNRFGCTDELGLFEMSQSGLEAVLNPSEILLSEEHYESEVMIGQAVAVVMDGSRNSLLKIQALCLPSETMMVHVNGILHGRVKMIVVALMMQAGLKLQRTAIFINVLSGVKIRETAGDLAIAAAICSRRYFGFLEFRIPSAVAFIGEIGVGGELHMVPGMKERVRTVAKLGYKMCIIPRSAEKFLSNSAFDGMVIVGCRNLKEVINTVFGPRLVTEA